MRNVEFQGSLYIKKTEHIEEVVYRGLMQTYRYFYLYIKMYFESLNKISMCNKRLLW